MASRGDEQPTRPPHLGPVRLCACGSCDPHTNDERSGLMHLASPLQGSEDAEAVFCSFSIPVVTRVEQCLCLCQPSCNCLQTYRMSHPWSLTSIRTRCAECAARCPITAASSHSSVALASSVWDQDRQDLQMVFTCSDIYDLPQPNLAISAVLPVAARS